MREHDRTDAETLAAEWSTAVLRFFHLLLGNQSLAETLTIETLAEQLRGRAARSPRDIRVSLLRCAFLKGLATQAPPPAAAPLLRAMVNQPVLERAVLVLVGGLALDARTVVQITGLSLREVTSLCLSASQRLQAELQSA